MRSVYRAVMSIIACGLFGAGYGAIAGAVYGTCVWPLAGTIVGLVLGIIFGFVAGIVGGSLVLQRRVVPVRGTISTAVQAQLVVVILGGPIGWSIGGLTGGTITLPLLVGWDRHSIDIHLWAFWIWTIFPGLIGAAMGMAIGRDLQRESPDFPAVRWLRGTTCPCRIGEWLWWRRGRGDPSSNPWDTIGTQFRFQLPGRPMRWAISLCLAGVLLVAKSWHDDFQSRSRRPVRFLIPSGYVGWVQVQFGAPGAPLLPIENGFYLVRVPSNGLTRTSTHIKCGLVNRDEFYDMSGDHRQLLDSSGIYGSGKASGSRRVVRTWGSGYEEGSFQSARSGAPPVKFEGLFYFIGTEAQFHQAGPPPAPELPG